MAGLLPTGGTVAGEIGAGIVAGAAGVMAEGANAALEGGSKLCKDRVDALETGEDGFPEGIK